MNSLKSENYVPEQGDIAWMILDPRVGHEQSGRRPVIILSKQKFSEKTGLVIVSPITSKIKGLPYEIVLSGTKTSGAILPIHVKSVDYRQRKATFIEKAPNRITAKAIKGVSNIIGL